MKRLFTFGCSYTEYWWFAEEKTGKWRETHPSIIHYRNWLVDCVLPKIPVSSKSIEEIDKITNSIEELKRDYPFMVDFIEELKKNNFYQPEKLVWPRIVYGF